jgi:hypothetical protein
MKNHGKYINERIFRKGNMNKLKIRIETCHPPPEKCIIGIYLTTEIYSISICETKLSFFCQKYINPDFYSFGKNPIC